VASHSAQKSTHSNPKNPPYHTIPYHTITSSSSFHVYWEAACIYQALNNGQICCKSFIALAKLICHKVEGANLVLVVIFVVFVVFVVVVWLLALC